MGLSRRQFTKEFKLVHAAGEPIPVFPPRIPRPILRYI